MQVHQDGSVTVAPDIRALALATARDACINETLCCREAVRELAGETDENVLAALRS